MLPLSFVVGGVGGGRLQASRHHQNGQPVGSPAKPLPGQFYLEIQSAYTLHHSSSYDWSRPACSSLKVELGPSYKYPGPPSKACHHLVGANLS